VQNCAGQFSEEGPGEMEKMMEAENIIKNEMKGSGNRIKKEEKWEV
jgi:hypothetical protein